MRLKRRKEIFEAMTHEQLVGVVDKLFRIVKDQDEKIKELEEKTNEIDELLCQYLHMD